jgi:hypothetical protein
LEKLFWNKHKNDSSPMELKSFSAILNYCLFCNEDSSIFISNVNANQYFCPLILEYKIVATYKTKVLEVSTNVHLLLSTEFDIYIIFLSYFKDITDNNEFDYLISFIEKLRFWKKSKSRFIKNISIIDNCLFIDFKSLSPRVSSIIFD